MTKKLFVCVLAVVLALSAVVFVGCVDKPQVQEVTELTLPTMADDQMAVIVKNGKGDYTNVVVTLGEKGVNAKNVEEVLDYLNKEGILSVTWQDSSYGKFLNGIGNAKPQAENEFVSVLTSVEKDKGNFADVTRYSVGGIELVSSQFGVSQMTVEAGAVIYFEIATF